MSGETGKVFQDDESDGMMDAHWACIEMVLIWIDLEGREAEWNLR